MTKITLEKSFLPFDFHLRASRTCSSLTLPLTTSTSKLKVVSYLRASLPATKRISPKILSLKYPWNTLSVQIHGHLERLSHCEKVQLDALPSLISCSPIPVPLTSGRELFLSRRDLFDARFQLISEGKDIYEEQTSDQTQDKKEGTSALGFIDAPSDLVPGVYEGGLKTWECSLDLVDYLDSLKDGPDNVDPHGKRILEVCCNLSPQVSNTDLRACRSAAGQVFPRYTSYTKSSPPLPKMPERRMYIYKTTMRPFWN